jgi:UrcA family protein
MKETLKIIAVSALATAAIIKVVPALAEPAPAQNVSIVRTADLDLTSRAGRDILEHRLVIAAYQVCDGASDADLAGKNGESQCRHDVLAKAHADTQHLASLGAQVLVAASR